MRLYEAMWVVDINKAKEDFTQIQTELKEIITRHGGEVVNCDKWEDRKLAYPIERQTRATYVLSHFNAPSESIKEIQRRATLSESVLRVLITLDEDGTDTAKRDTMGDESKDRRRSGSKDERPARRAPSEDAESVPASEDA